MAKMSFLEKAAVNILTPIDVAIDLLPYSHESFLRNFLSPSKIAASWKSMSGIKNKSYEFLVETLEEKGPRKKLLDEYMNNPCGRIQMRVAKSKGYISKADYKSAKQNYPFKGMVKSVLKKESD